MHLGTIILSLRLTEKGPSLDLVVKGDSSLSPPPSAPAVPWVCLVQQQPKALVSVGELSRKFAFICQHQSPWFRMGSLPPPTLFPWPCSSPW